MKKLEYIPVELLNEGFQYLTTIPELTDESTVETGDLWIKLSTGGGGNLLFSFGLGTPITQAGTGRTYHLSYKTKSGNIIRMEMT